MTITDGIIFIVAAIIGLVIIDSVVSASNFSNPVLSLILGPETSGLRILGVLAGGMWLSTR